MSTEVVLTPLEMLVAELVGKVRFDRSKGLLDADGATKNEADEVDAVCAEMAFGKWRDLYYEPTVDTFKAQPDVGWFEVRHTCHEHGCLRLTKRDLDGRPYVLVTGGDNIYVVRGWLYGREGKLAEWWGDWPDPSRPPAFFVKQHALRPAITLLEWADADGDEFIEQAKAMFPGSVEVDAA